MLKVALLGRPNVGKSTLFNRLIRSNRAITHDRPGVTRDRMEGVVKIRGEEPFAIIDTGGVTLETQSQVGAGPEGLRGFEEAILSQARDAVGESALLCLVVDGRDGLTPFDQHLADFLRKSNKPLILIVNKVDGPEKAAMLTAEFHGLGLPLYFCSAAHGYRVRELEAALCELLFSKEEEQECEAGAEDIFLEGATKRQRRQILQESRTAMLGLEEDQEQEAIVEEEAEDQDLELAASNVQSDEGDVEEAKSLEDEPLTGPLRIALLGRPNAGKSSLVNAFAKQDRMIVSNMPGTTRDSVDVGVMVNGEPCIFVDTAGVRRRSKITDVVERYSVNSSLKSTTKAHVTLLVLDATEGLTQQDKRLIELLASRKTPFMVLVNKSDLVNPQERKTVEKQYKDALVFCPHVPLLFISALKRRNINKVVPLALAIRQECGVRIGTGQLNRSLGVVLDTHQPPMVKGARPKFFYLTQPETFPPTFVFFVSDAERILPSYARYLEKSLRKLFQIQHAPMRVHFRSSHKKK